MQRLIGNQSCKLYHTAYCDMLNMPTCEDCFVNQRAEAEQVMEDLDILRTLMPIEGVTHLFATDECVLCKGDKGKRAYYAMLDMGHEQPVREKRTIIGMKTKTKVGSMMPVQLGACAQCRKRIRTLDNLPGLLPLGMATLSLALLMVNAINEALLRVHPIMPFALFLGTTLIGAALGKWITGSLHKEYAKHTHIDPFELPTVSHMREKGWFALNAGKSRPRMIFSKKRMRMGVGTGMQEDALCDWEDANIHS